ncbi:MAG: calcium-binding protein [Arenibacterium sp.]
MTVTTVHRDNKITKSVSFQQSLLGALQDASFEFTAISAGQVVLATPDPTRPQYDFFGSGMDVAPDGSLRGLVERIEIRANASASDPSVLHNPGTEVLLADFPFTAGQGTGAPGFNNYRNFYGLLGGFINDGQINGSDKADTLEPHVNVNLIRGFGGNDTFIFVGEVTYDGGKGVDLLDVSASERRVVVDLTRDVATDGNASTLISIEGVTGGDGDDTLTGNGKKNTLTGNGGDDEVNGGGGKDRIFGNSGNDNLEGGSGADKIFAGAGDDRAEGQGGDDLIVGGFGNDVLLGGSGSDTIRGENGDDELVGAGGKDRLIGGNNRDLLKGGDSNDVLKGGGGRDKLFGDDGNDQLFGGGLKDVLDGGSGDDDMWGQGGSDVFRFLFHGRNDSDNGNDTIHDYRHGSDEIWLVNIRASDVVTVEQQGRDSLVRIVAEDNGIGVISTINVLNVTLTFDDLSFTGAI